MKNSILTIAIASVLIACNSKPSEEVVSVKQSTTDTSRISEFEKWKDQQELMAENESFETAAPVEEKQAAVAPKVVSRNAPAKQASVAKVRSAAPVRKSTVARKPVSRPKTTTSSSGGSGSNESTAGAGTGSAGSGSGTSTPAETPQEEKKEGWSKAAKGTAIGGASGAVLGAIISKDNKGKGAVIGAVVGAAGGYVLGRRQDKKDGRY
jgi:hypothetical protein